MRLVLGVKMGAIWVSVRKILRAICNWKTIGLQRDLGS